MSGDWLSLEQIYAHYRELVRRYAPPAGLVLKTDAYNEAVGGFRSLAGCGLDPARTIYVEWDVEVIDLARRRHPELDIRQGDIRQLPFEDGTFVAVFDLSTIDHVLPVEACRVLAEYQRVLAPGGVLVLVAWCSERPPAVRRAWSPREQYYLSEADLRVGLLEFRIEVWRRFHEEPPHYLLEVVARSPVAPGFYS